MGGSKVHSHPFSDNLVNTVEPVYTNHPWNLRNWPLDTDGCFMQDHYKILTESGLKC